MPSTRRNPNAVASQATVGAIMICEAVAAVLSQAPSSKLRPNAPLRSGSPIVNSRLSKLARNAPNNTAPTAKIGRCDTVPVDTGPAWMCLASGILVSYPALSRAVLDMDTGHRRHARQQPVDQGLPLVERDPDRNALNDLGEVTGGMVGRQQRELRSAGRRNALDPAMQRFIGE